MRSMGHAIEHFAVPHPAPEPVEKASAKFEQISADFQAARAKFYALKTSRLDDIAAANLAAAEARVEGGKPPTLTPAKIDANIAKAEAEMNVLHEACDLAHTALLEAVAEHRDEWIELLEEADTETTERIRVLLEGIRQAVDELQVIRSAPEWLRDFHVSAGQTQWHGGRPLYKMVGAIHRLETIVVPEKVLVGYTDGDGIWEEKIVGQEKLRPMGTGKRDPVLMTEDGQPFEVTG